MYTTKCKKFKGEIETYLSKEKNIFESRMDRVFRMLSIQTNLNQANIRKKDGYHALHLLFIVSLLTLLKIPTIHSFCRKQWYHWCVARKDAFYRFKRNPSRWRSVLYAIIHTISEKIGFAQYPLKERYFVIDDSPIPKRGRHLENVSFLYDHSIGRTFLGYGIVSPRLFTGENFYHLDSAYRFDKKRHPKSPEEKIEDPRSIAAL